MPTPIDDTSDFEKLANAFSALTDSFGSVDSILEAFGLKDMPLAQRYGILFGCITFVCTVTAVITLLVLGGSFRRMAEQSRQGGNTVPSSIEARASRPLLLEELLEARERLLRAYEMAFDNKSPFTTLTRILMNDAPKGTNVAELVDDDSKKRIRAKSGVSSEFEQNYLVAYRTCQDKPGGAALGGLPEARFEAYARAYAGCGSWSTTAYRRSYARLYEKMACSTHGMEKKYTSHYETRPQDIVGRTVRLEPLETDRHFQDFYDITSGQQFMDAKSFDPMEVWAFWDFGPFASPEQMSKSWVFQRKKDNEAAFAIVEMMTDRLIGVIFVTNDDAQNLNTQLELPICKPSSHGTAEELEACFLLLDRLFGLGYRRVQLAMDTQDVMHKKLPARLGFTQEGMIPKHMIVKEANRDSLIYGMLNSDWSKGARGVLYKKLHGAKMLSIDELNNKKEGELEQQQNVLRERQLEQEAAMEQEKENKKP